MDEVGLRELRQHASEIVRRVQAGESLTVTVSGRPAARIVPVEQKTWRRFGELNELFAGPDDTDWGADRDRLDESAQDPWPT